ncbi:uncharacterized protein LOC132350948 [Balaenoptera ricei]|uniref:uncharacterized protein LOC132350948 n=1 Tax=Balaenoptera ricei TaxID=2746895 RepID=UPI0028BE48B7|nr:uncharacterized protein LOC132350948 [Balaenoptera ricei]
MGRSPALGRLSPSNPAARKLETLGRGLGCYQRSGGRLAAAARESSARRGVSSTNRPERGSGGGFNRPQQPHSFTTLNREKNRLHTYSLLPGRERRSEGSEGAGRLDHSFSSSALLASTRDARGGRRASRPRARYLRSALVPAPWLRRDRASPGCARGSREPRIRCLAAAAAERPARQLEGRGRRYPGRLPPSGPHQQALKGFRLTHFLDVKETFPPYKNKTPASTPGRGGSLRWTMRGRRGWTQGPPGRSAHRPPQKLQRGQQNWKVIGRDGIWLLE